MSNWHYYISYLILNAIQKVELIYCSLPLLWTIIGHTAKHDLNKNHYRDIFCTTNCVYDFTHGLNYLYL